MSNIKIFNTLNLLRLSQHQCDLPPELLELLGTQRHLDPLILLGLDLQNDFRPQDLGEVVGAEDDVDFPLAARVSESLLLLSHLDVFGRVLVLLNLRSVNHKGLVVGEQADLLVVLAVEQIHLLFQSQNHFGREMLERIKLVDLKLWLRSQKLVNCTERYSDVQSQLLQWN